MKKILCVILIIVVVIIGYYFLSPLFKNIKIQDALPEMNEMSKNISTSTNYKIQTGTTITSKVFSIVDTRLHPATGTVRIVESVEGRILRYENFKTINGPDLHIYLAKDLSAKEYIDLGKIKGTEGNINYPIPDGVDLSAYPYVMYWCEPFKVLFNYAFLGE